MKRVPTDVVKNRSRKITELFNSYNPYDHLVGTKQRVWITETARDGKNLVGHTKGYVQVIIDPSEASMGSDVVCSIYESGKFFIKGKVILKNENNLKKIVQRGFVRKLKNTKSSSASSDSSSSEKTEDFNEISSNSTSHNFSSSFAANDDYNNTCNDSLDPNYTESQLEGSNSNTSSAPTKSFLNSSFLLKLFLFVFVVALSYFFIQIKMF